MAEVMNGYAMSSYHQHHHHQQHPHHRVARMLDYGNPCHHQAAPVQRPPSSLVIAPPQPAVLQPVLQPVQKPSLAPRMILGSGTLEHNRLQQQIHLQQQMYRQQIQEQQQQLQKMRRSSSSSTSSSCSSSGSAYEDNKPQSVLYPFNESLDDELERLFGNFKLMNTPPEATKIREEFQTNGTDYEYCPDPIDPQTIVRKKNKKPLATECVFCKNNGEAPWIYKDHPLKDAEDRVVCPILRAYVCPKCGACGDTAHTVKYCPLQQSNLISLVNLRNFRNSTGRRRSR